MIDPRNHSRPGYVLRATTHAVKPGTVGAVREAVTRGAGGSASVFAVGELPSYDSIAFVRERDLDRVRDVSEALARDYASYMEAYPHQKDRYRLIVVRYEDALCSKPSEFVVRTMAGQEIEPGSLPHAHWLIGAREALEPYQPLPPPPALSEVSPRSSLTSEQKIRVEGLFGLCMENSMKQYSVEEIRRCWLPKYPELTREHVNRCIRPYLRTDREVDRFGDEPHFHLAVHIAHYMLGAAPGTTEEQVMKYFLANERLGVRRVYPHFKGSAEDLQALRAMYPFIPRWPGGVKTEECLDLRAKPFPDFGIGLQDVWTVFLNRLEKYVSIPLCDHVLQDVADVRDEEAGGRFDALAGYAVCRVAATVSDAIGYLRMLVARDRIPGRLIWQTGKTYSSDEFAVDVARRVLDVNTSVHDTDEEVKSAFERSVDAAHEATGKVAVEVEGVLGFWDSKRFREKVDLAVSHTSSDFRDLVEKLKGKFRALISGMARSQAKTEDERHRFQFTLADFVGEMLRAFGEPLLERHWLIVGYGELMGPSMKEALESVRAQNHSVYDIDVAKRRALKAEGVPIIDSLDEVKGRALVIVSAAGRLTLSREELRALAAERSSEAPPEDLYGERDRPPMYLVSLGSGRREFDMDWVEREALFKRRVALIGNERAVEYVVDLGDGPQTLVVLADGYPANLAFTHPTPQAYASTTALESWESLRQVAHLRKTLGQKARGLVDFTSTEIHITDEKTPRRVVVLNPWSSKAGSAKDEVDALRDELAGQPDASYFFARRTDEGLKLVAQLPRFGTVARRTKARLRRVLGA